MILYVGTRCETNETPHLLNHNVRNSFSRSPDTAREHYVRVVVHGFGPVYVSARIRAQRVELKRAL